MKSLAHLSDAALRHELIAAVARDRITTAELLAHIAEFDARKLYVPEGYSSMHAYCVEELHLSEDAAYKRIRAARAGRRFPALLIAIDEGQIHLAAAYLLAPHLEAENVDELILAATHRRKSEVEELIARRFPGSDGAIQAFSSIRPISWPAQGDGQDLPCFLNRAESQANEELAPGPVGLDREDAKANGSDVQLAPGPVAATRTAVSLLPERYLVQVTIGKVTHEKLRRIQALLSHAVPSGDVAEVLDRVFDVALETLEKRRVGAGSLRSSSARTTRSSSPRRKGHRYIPARVRRAVWERDQGQCTFVSTTGHRCGARRFLQFDHVEPVARGGEATVQGIRLRCHAHNQYEAEQVFGSEFMRQKREEARLAAVDVRKRAEARARATKEQEARALAREQAKDVLAGLRGLGCRADQAKRAAQFVETLSCDTLEERMRAALGFISRASARYSGSPDT